MRRLTLGVLLVLGIGLGLACPPGLAAQVVLSETTDLDSDRPEAWAMNYFGSLVSMTSLGEDSVLATGVLQAGQIEVGIELGTVPQLSEEERRVGFNGQKVENLNRTPVLARGRVSAGLGHGFRGSLSWIPPLEIDGAEANVLAVSVSRSLIQRRATSTWALGLRVGGTFGTLEGDITCESAAANAGNDPVLNPFSCEQASNDSLRVRAYSATLVGSWKPRADSRWALNAEIGATRFDNEFRVNALYSGLIDQTRLLSTDTAPSAALGAAFSPNASSSRRPQRYSIEVFYAPLDIQRPNQPVESQDVISVRLAAAIRLR